MSYFNYFSNFQFWPCDFFDQLQMPRFRFLFLEADNFKTVYLHKRCNPALKRYNRRLEKLKNNTGRDSRGLIVVYAVIHWGFPTIFIGALKAGIQISSKASKLTGNLIRKHEHLFSIENGEK